MKNARTPSRRALIDALEPRQLLAATPLRIAAGSAGYFTDALARTFTPAAGRFVGGRDEFLPTPTLLNTDDDALFAQRRSGTHLTFSASAAPGRYTLWVEFAETSATAAGQRVFDVSAEGALMADDVDPFARAGNDAFAIAGDVTISDGLLNLGFDASVGEAFVNAIVLVPTDVPAESQPYDPTRNTSEASNVTLSQSRLVRIGSAVYLYANENRGKFPASLAVLVTNVDMPIELLVNPRSATRPPRGELSRIEQFAYAQTLNDYRYVGAALRSSATASDVIAYENPERAAGDVNVLYADGHVARVTRAAAASLPGFIDVAPTGAAPPLAITAVDPTVLQSQLKLRDLSNAASLYQIEQGGRYPADIGALAHYVSASAFSNPRLGAAAAPPVPAGATFEEAAAWVNAHSDYVLLRPTVRTSTVAPGDVLFYEKPAGLTGGLNVALANGGVFFREMRWAYESIASHSPPLVIDAKFDLDSGSIRVRFDEDVSSSLAAGDLVVRNLTTGQTLAASSMRSSYFIDPHTASFSFPGFANGILPDGDYVATLAPGSVADAAGNGLATASTLSFFSYAGDADHDRDVDFADLIVLAQNYGQSFRAFSQGNFDRDAAGRVDFADLVILAQRYNQRLTALVAAPVAASAPAKKTASRQAAVNGIV